MQDKPLWIGEWRVDPITAQLSRDSEVRRLEPRSMRLLMFLAARPGEVLSIQEILQGVWSDVIVTPESVYQVIASLRRSLGDKSGDPAYIVTVPRRGYRLIAAVTPWVEVPPSVDDVQATHALPTAPPPAPVDPPASMPSATAAAHAPRFYGGMLAVGATIIAVGLMAVSIWQPARPRQDPLVRTTVTFDDLTTPGQEGTDGIGLVPPSYAGLDWNCAGNPRCTTVDVFSYGANPSGYQDAMVSPPNVLSTGYGDGFVATHLKITRTGGGTFSLNSAYFTSPWYDGLFVAVMGETQNPPFHNLTFTLDAAGVRRFQTFNWDHLTSVFITTSGGHPSHRFRDTPVPTLAIDDLTYTVGEDAPP